MFFQQLSDIGAIDLTMRIKSKNGKLTISVLPDGVANVLPLILTGTPQELDEAFIEKISAPLQKVAGLVVNPEAFDKASPSKAVTEKLKPKPSDKKPAPAKEKADDEDTDDQEEDEDDEAEEAAVAPTKKAAAPKPEKQKPAPTPAPQPQPEGPKQLSIL